MSSGPTSRTFDLAITTCTRSSASRWTRATPPLASPSAPPRRAITGQNGLASSSLPHSSGSCCSLSTTRSSGTSAPVPGASWSWLNSPTPHLKACSPARFGRSPSEWKPSSFAPCLPPLLLRSSPSPSSARIAARARIRSHFGPHLPHAFRTNPIRSNPHAPSRNNPPSPLRYHALHPLHLLHQHLLPRPPQLRSRYRTPAFPATAPDGPRPPLGRIQPFPSGRRGPLRHPRPAARAHVRRQARLHHRQHPPPQRIWPLDHPFLRVSLHPSLVAPLGASARHPLRQLRR